MFERSNVETAVDRHLVDLTVSGEMFEIVDLGPIAASNSFRIGYPYPNRTSDIIVSAAPNAAGNGFNFMCDAGISLAPTPEEFGSYGIERGGATVSELRQRIERGKS